MERTPLGHCLEALRCHRCSASRIKGCRAAYALQTLFHLHTLNRSLIIAMVFNTVNLFIAFALLFASEFSYAWVVKSVPKTLNHLDARQSSSSQWPYGYHPQYAPQACFTTISGCPNLQDRYTNCLFNDVTKVNECACKAEVLSALTSCLGCARATNDVSWLFAGGKPEDIDKLQDEAYQTCAPYVGQIDKKDRQIPHFRMSRIGWPGPMIAIAIFWAVAGFALARSFCMGR
ncbi:hypothetical protein DL96DRAFT_1617912 [Flagelloscypha sp. PMI_526]|nr:hypothetical protein DL96DRAFT_1617912 [Flagelloscypha sp. PMI_526]